MAYATLLYTMEKMKTIDLSKEKEDIKLIIPLSDGNMSLTTNEQGHILTFIPPKQDPMDLVPKSWEQYVESRKGFLSEKAIVQAYQGFYFLTYSAKDAEALIALAKLRLLWHEWVTVLGKPTTSKYYTIHYFRSISRIEVSYSIIGILSFKEESHAEKFIECFPDLLEKAKILL